MSGLFVGVVFSWLLLGLFVALGAWLGFQLVHQNGRLLSHLEGIEQRLAALMARPLPAPGYPLGAAPAAPAPQPAAAPPRGPAPGPTAWAPPDAARQNAAPPPQGLPLGSTAPAFELPDLSGKRHSLAEFRDKKLLAIFFNPNCGFCSRMAPDLAALPSDGKNGKPIPLVITTGNPEDTKKLFAEHGVSCPVLLQQEMEIAAQYQCHGTPMGYLIDEQGQIASEMTIGGPPLLALADAGSPGAANGQPAAVQGAERAAGALGGQRELLESKIQRDGLPAGTPAPDFRLPLLHGGELSLSDYQGRKVLLVFSDPNCGPCDQLAPQLEQLARRTVGVQVLMVSKGEPEANRAKAAQYGLTFPIVLQKQWEVSREYAKFATPIGYLIDEAGIIAKEIAIGVEPILSLPSAPALAPSNGKGKAPHQHKELARRR